MAKIYDILQEIFLVDIPEQYRCHLSKDKARSQLTEE